MIVIAWCRVQYEKYFTSSFVLTYFTSHRQVKYREIKEREKYFNTSPSYNEITILSLDI